MYLLLWTILALQNVYSSNALEDEDVISSSVTDTRGMAFSVFLQLIEILAHIPMYSLGSYYLRTVVRMYVSQMVYKIGQLLVAALPIKECGHLQGFHNG